MLENLIREIAQLVGGAVGGSHPIESLPGLFTRETLLDPVRQKFCFANTPTAIHHEQSGATPVAKTVQNRKFTPTVNKQLRIHDSVVYTIVVKTTLECDCLTTDVSLVRCRV
jgi:hypothetical protein